MSREQSLKVRDVATGVAVAISTSNAQSGILSHDDAVVISTVDCFVAKGANPVATTSHQFVPASTPLRLWGWKVGEQLAFVTASGTGTVYISPGG